MRRGVFITFEGGEGLGKSTQISLLAKQLRKLGAKVIVTREPGGTPEAEKLRRILKEEPLSPLAEVFVVEASRAEHVEKLIEPALKRGMIVLCDRFQESTLVYQGLVQGISQKLIQQANRMATSGLSPNRIILLDGGTQRLRNRSKKDKFDSAGQKFHRDVRKAYLKLAKTSPRWRIFDAEQDRLTLHHKIFQDVKPLVWKFCRHRSKKS